jgi:starvation-inducible DNA-binding protein
MSNNTVINGLNGILANAIVEYQKLHHFHWQVSGERFFELHGKFEEYYNKFAGIIDDVAERILMIGGSPMGTLSSALKQATISEENETVPAADMVHTTLNDFAILHIQMQKVIEEADKDSDRGTVNLLDGMADGLEKDMWMLRAYLQKNASSKQKKSAA